MAKDKEDNKKVNKSCNHCQGFGRKSVTDGDSTWTIPCSACNGTGRSR